MFDPKAKCRVVPPSSSMQQCIDTYGIEGEGEWVNNSISRNAQCWSCGLMSGKSFVPQHDHDPQELARCHKLSQEAAKVMGSVWQLQRSGSDPLTQPFFVAAQRKADAPSRVDESLIRAVLGGTLHPDAVVTIEPLTEGTQWWQELEEDANELLKGAQDSTFDDMVNEWRELIAWFSAKKLSNPSFVRTTDSDKPSRTLGCVFPCFVVGLTTKGSLVGIGTHVVS